MRKTIETQEFQSQQPLISDFVWCNPPITVSLYLYIQQSSKVYQQVKAINRIKSVLAEKQVSGKWLTTQVGHAENTVSRWCSNKVQPSLDNLVKVAEVLEVDIRDLLRPTLNK